MGTQQKTDMEIGYQQASKSFLEVLDKKISYTQQVLDGLLSQGLENIPDTVRMHREHEASRYRAVLGVLKELRDTYTALYPTQ